MRRTLSTYIFAAAAFLAVTPPAAHGQRDRDRDRDEYASRIDTTIAFSRNGTVELQVGDGEIIVSSWSRDQVRVRATSERSVLRLDASPSSLSLGLRSGSSRSGDTRFEVTVPVGVRIRANTTSGDIRIAGSKGEVEVRTQRGDIVVEDVGRTDITAFSGDIEASGIAGDLRVNVLSGDVQIRQVTGDIEVKTVSGEVDLRDARSKYVRLGSTSGDITFDGAIDPAGRYELQTHSGDVELTLPASVGATLMVSTYSGGIESDFPLTLNPGQHGEGGGHGKQFTFTLGRGGARITAESFSGDINIRSRGGPTGRNEGDRNEADRR
jgi:DUF4097 and DUF4098 domain-containing protein YvlB